MDGWMDWMIDWLDDWLDGWLDDWLIGWLIGWLFGWLIDWLIDWLYSWCFTHRQTRKVVSGLTVTRATWLKVHPFGDPAVGYRGRRNEGSPLPLEPRAIQGSGFVQAWSRSEGSSACSACWQGLYPPRFCLPDSINSLPPLSPHPLSPKLLRS